MKELSLNIQEFILFDDDDQFGFFYNEDGYPSKDASERFMENVCSLYKKYEYICVDAQDNIYGMADGRRELLMEDVIEAYRIAKEVKDG
jgi:hypothetical protein